MMKYCNQILIGPLRPPLLPRFIHHHLCQRLRGLTRPPNMLLSSTLFLFFSLGLVKAGSVTEGGSCSQGNNRLQLGTYQFYSDCDSVTYCSPDGVCRPKGCKKDDYPFGYAQDDPKTPDKCPRGQFCPDEADACQPLLAVGSECQLNRDGLSYQSYILKHVTYQYLFRRM